METQIQLTRKCRSGFAIRAIILILGILCFFSTIVYMMVTAPALEWTTGVYNVVDKKCRWVDFYMGYHKVCVHAEKDTVSDEIASVGKWRDCDIISTLWNSMGDDETGEYIEIGANIGACMMEMLMKTDAKITVFEPNPVNLFCLTSTKERLPTHLRSRITVYPFALGDRESASTLYSSSVNYENSVVGKMVGGRSERGNARIDKYEIKVRRYDSVISPKKKVKLLKLDAQGFACSIIRGMGVLIPKVIKTEIANKWLSAQKDCSAQHLFELFHTNNMQVYSENNNLLAQPKYTSSSHHYDVVARAKKNESYDLFKTRSSVPECKTPKIFPDTSTSKMICLDNIVPGSCVVYSFGINYQWDFDDYMHDYGCTVYSFDPGMNYKSKRAERHFFEKIGIGANTGIHTGASTLYSGKKNYNVETIDSIMNRLGHSNLDLLRLDTEGAEFEALSSLPFDKIGQFSVEIHMWSHSFDDWKSKLMKISLQHLQTYQNTDGINKKTMQEVSPGVTRVYEMTFMKK